MKHGYQSKSVGFVTPVNYGLHHTAEASPIEVSKREFQFTITVLASYRQVTDIYDITGRDSYAFCRYKQTLPCLLYEKRQEGNYTYFSYKLCL